MFGGNLPSLIITAEDTGNTRVDEFGETVPVYRVLSAQVINSTGYTWLGTIWQNGAVVLSAQITPGMDVTHNFKKNQQFLWHEYGVGVGRN